MCVKFSHIINLIKMFLDNSVDSRLPCNFNLRDVNGDTPICVALNEGFCHLVPILIEVS